MTTEWLVRVPVREGTADRRLQLRPQHYAEVRTLLEQGVITFAGGILARPSKDGSNRDMTVTLFTVAVATEAEARQILERDVYTKEGIWDAGQAEIVPFQTGIRKAMGA